ncbi:hypothetical protein [Leeuwenhoekiella blandensis]|uniref:Uncharacterized protein n=1 Tax=Leeuwenhoekiella blandensis (strain CECT 7118 / CCUG 51940 / KCTC 22103 / MED217) TaxID=398720 RepID=A3XLI3_LEEBM|nr:hypothetical protein [Leeuwenhoekiella blandensis]EAQ49586.1 hypothetical protein MED217_12044 [Leeuwenhoekiella blandensis MED217]
MKKKERLDYVDCALRINNIQLSEQILKTTLACVDLVDKSRGKATLDECLIINKKENE